MEMELVGDKLYHRPDVHYSPVEKPQCYHICTAYGWMMKEEKKNKEKKKETVSSSLEKKKLTVSSSLTQKRTWPTFSHTQKTARTTFSQSQAATVPPEAFTRT